LFGNNLTELINIATGATPDAETSLSIVTAMAQRAEMAQKFIQDRLLNARKYLYTAIHCTVSLRSCFSDTGCLPGALHSI